jgi:hypothetical protein
MLCFLVLSCRVLSCFVLYYFVLWCDVLCYFVFCSVVLFCAVLLFFVLYRFFFFDLVLLSCAALYVVVSLVLSCDFLVDSRYYEEGKV